MNIVVDSSIIIAVVSSEPSEPALIQLTKGHALIAPTSIPHEVGNALSAMLKRRRATLEQVLNAIERFWEIPIAFINVDLTTSLRIAHACNMYAYDAYLIASAAEHDCPLLSLDRRLQEHARANGVQVPETGR